MNALARAAAFLASHREASQLTGECLSVSNENEGRLVWRGNEPVNLSKPLTNQSLILQPMSRSSLTTSINKVRVAITIDLDAVSGWLGTGMVRQMTLMCPGGEDSNGV